MFSVNKALCRLPEALPAWTRGPPALAVRKDTFMNSTFHLYYLAFYSFPQRLEGGCGVLAIKQSNETLGSWL